MKNLCLVLVTFLLIFQFTVGFAQDAKLDSLEKVLKNHPNRDSLRINELRVIADYHFLKNIDKAEPFLREAIMIATELGNYNQVSELKTELTRHYVSRGLFKEGLEEILAAIDIQDSIQAPTKEKINTLNILSTVYRGYGNNEKSLEIILEVIELSKNLPSDVSQVRYYMNAGQTFAQLNDVKKAIEYSLMGKEIAKKIGEKRIEIIMTSVLGDLYKNNGEYDKAKSMLNASLPYYIENKEERNLASTYRLLAANESLQGNHKASIPNYEKALEIFDKTGNLYWAKTTNQNLYITYSIVGDKENADLANKRYEKLKDSLDSKERKGLIAEMETKFETEKVTKEKEIAELQSTKNKNLFIGSAIIGGLILLSSILYFGRARATKKAQLVAVELKETQKRLAIEKQYRDSELKALKAQMNPHFIFNALNSIQEYIVLNEKNLASDYLGKFADLMRKYLYHSDKGSISVEDEVACLNTYLELEKVRFEDTLDYSITVANAIPVENTYIPTMIIQPYVENAIKHGLLHKKKDRNLSIVLVQEEKYIKCTIEDNGVGREKAKALQENSKREHKSFATKATQDRLALLNFGKNQKIGVEIIDLYDDNSLPKGTRVVVTIPQIKT